MRTRCLVGIAVGIAASVSVAFGGGDASAPKGSRADARVELGRRLFFDPAASRAGMRACADCHVPAHGYSDPAAESRDDRGPTRRHSQTLIDGADNPSAHWDGAFRRVEDLVIARLTLTPAKRGTGHGSGASHGGRSAPSSGGYGGGSTGGARDTEGGGLSGGQPGSGTPPAGGQPGGAPGGSGGYGQGEEPGQEEPEPERDDDDGMDGGGCPPPPPSGDPRHRNAPGSAGPSTREPAPEAEPTPPAEPTPSAPPPPPPAAAPGALPDAPPSAPTPAPNEPSSRPSAYVEDTTPDDGIEFVGPEVDLTRLPPAHEVLDAAGRYREAFVAAFGSPDVTTQRIAQAIGAYCRSIRSGTAAYDRHVAGDASALSPSARRGLALFRGPAGCASCHVLSGDRASFTDYALHDTGVSWKGLPGKTDAERAEVAASFADDGAFAVTTRPRDRRAFKTPTLRDVTLRAPWFHDGSAATLEAVVRHYLSGPIGDPALDPKMPTLVASDAQVADLVEFLQSLTSDVRPGSSPAAWEARVSTTRLRFVDADGEPLALWPVTLAPAGDELAALGAREPLRLTTDAQGFVEAKPFATTHARVVLDGGLRPVGGALVPDTCRSARLQVPVRGSAVIVVTLAPAQRPPEALVVEHRDRDLCPDRRTPRTVLRLVTSLPLDDGRSTSLYRAPFRADVRPAGALRLPTPRWGLDHVQVTLQSGRATRVDLSR